MTEVMRRVLALGGLRGLVMAALTAPAVAGLSLLVIRSVGEQRAPAVLVTISILGSAAALVANPLLGWCADRWPGRHGSRRPWLVGGASLGLAGSVLLAVADQPGMMALGWIIAQIGYNACFGALNGLVSTFLTPRWHQRAAGVFSASAYLGTLPGLAVAALAADHLAVMILTLPVITLIVIVVAAPFLPAPPALMGTSPSHSASASAAWKRLITPGVRMMFRGRFAAVVGLRMVMAAELAAGLTFGVYVGMERWSMSPSQAATFVVMMSVVGAIGIIVTSGLLALPWSRRVGERPWLLIALGGIAVSSVARAFAMDVPMFLAATFLGGLAIGCGITATRSAAHAALPPEESALGLGVLNVGNTLGPIVGPALAAIALGMSGAIGAADDYVGMFVVLAVPALLAMPLVLLVRQHSAADPAQPASPADSPPAEHRQSAPEL